MDGSESVPGIDPRDLVEVAERLKIGETVSPVSVRELLRWHSAARRGFWVNKRIRAQLDDLGLKTNPDFNDVYLDGLIRIELKGPENTEGKANVELEPVQLNATAVTSTDEAVARAADPTIRLSRLAAANKPLIYLKPGASLAEAVTQMLHYDYSQLPIMTTERDVKGVISWKSIGIRLCNGVRPQSVNDAMESAVEAADDVSLFAAIPLVVKHDYLLVRAADRRITGILTSSDLGLQFQQLAEPFLLLGEIENYLRRLIGNAGFTVGELASAVDPRYREKTILSAEDMSFGEYIRLLQNEVHWQKARLKLDRKIFCGHLEEVRQIRNDVMHFDPDGIEEKDLEKLRKLAHMFQQLGALDSIWPRRSV